MLIKEPLFTFKQIRRTLFAGFLDPSFTYVAIITGNSKKMINNVADFFKKMQKM